MIMSSVCVAMGCIIIGSLLIRVCYAVLESALVLSYRSNIDPASHSKIYSVSRTWRKAYITDIATSKHFGYLHGHEPASSILCKPICEAFASTEHFPVVDIDACTSGSNDLSPTRLPTPQAFATGKATSNSISYATTDQTVSVDNPLYRCPASDQRWTGDKGICDVGPMSFSIVSFIDTVHRQSPCWVCSRIPAFILYVIVFLTSTRYGYWNSHHFCLRTSTSCVHADSTSLPSPPFRSPRDRGSVKNTISACVGDPSVAMCNLSVLMDGTSSSRLLCRVCRLEIDFI